MQMEMTAYLLQTNFIILKIFEKNCSFLPVFISLVTSIVITVARCNATKKERKIGTACFEIGTYKYSKAYENGTCL